MMSQQGSQVCAPQDLEKARQWSGPASNQKWVNPLSNHVISRLVYTSLPSLLPLLNLMDIL